MSFSSQMTGGYPPETAIEEFLDGCGIELLTQHNPNYLAEFKQFVWGILNAVNWTMALGVYCPTPYTFNVRGGKYLFKDTLKTYTPGDTVNPTDNDTTYIWMKDDNTIGSGIDGSGWPATEHIKLAEIDVDDEGVITAVRDLRGEVFLQYLKNVTSHTGASAEMSPVFWDKGTPANDDEIRIPFYGRNAAGEKIEYARLGIKFTAVADGAEAATFSIWNMVAGTLTEATFVTASGAATLTNKTINGDNNTLSNIALASIKTVVGDADKVLMRDAAGASVSDKITGKNLADIGANGGVPFILMATLTAGNMVVIHNANAPFKYRVIQAWSIALSADGGTFDLMNGENTITGNQDIGAVATEVMLVNSIDITYHEIAQGGSFSVVGDGSLADCIVYIMCMRVA